MTGKNKFQIALFPGDGIGPEIIAEAVKVLAVVSSNTGVSFDLREGLIGGAAYDRQGEPFPGESLNLALQSDAVLLGAVGGPKWESLAFELRPERALLGLRRELGLFANLRPTLVYEELIASSPLRPELVKNIDIIIVRELTGDAYFGQPRGVRLENGRRVGINTMTYSEDEIERIARVGFNLAAKRRRRLLSVDKANVLEVSQLWRDVVTEVGRDYPEVEIAHMYVDNCAMQLIRNPRQFDVIVTSNMFGDILSDEASMLCGSIGLLPSASIGNRYAMYEPIHGSAPDIAGQGIANPLGTILSAAMMLDHSCGMKKDADLISQAVRGVLKGGFRTQDIYSEGSIRLSTSEMGGKIAETMIDMYRQ
ncbi:MAG: 3-isopropylmalate dehydrogenase [Smithellaceae bacterium]|nr:3-isopropylmalate dehydrogenase [Smithellaceae bacterium]